MEDGEEEEEEEEEEEDDCSVVMQQQNQLSYSSEKNNNLRDHISLICDKDKRKANTLRSAIGLYMLLTRER